MKNRRILFVLTAVLVTLAAAWTRADWSDRAFDGRRGKNDSPPRAESAPETAAMPMEGRVWVEIRASDKFERSRIADAGVSIEETTPHTVAGTATAKALERLRLAGISVTRKTSLGQFYAKGFPPSHATYHNYGEVRSALHALASSESGLVSEVLVGRSLLGRDIMAVRFNTTASGDAPSAKPGIVFMGTHHAREHLSTEVPLLLAQWLAQNRTRPDVRRLLETRDIYIIPLVNPDGSEYDYVPEDGSFRWQRKNMRRNEDASLGVDLNRNYGYHWGEGGASDYPSDETYRGPSAFSEPETQAIKRFVERRPNLKILLSYHTYSELILYPWGHTYDPINDLEAQKAYKVMAKKMAEWTGYTPEQSSELYIASGDTTDWAWGEKKIFSFTFELTPNSSWSGGFYPGDGAVQPTFEKNVKPALYLMDMADDPYRAATGGIAQMPQPARLRVIPPPALQQHVH